MIHSETKLSKNVRSYHSFSDSNTEALRPSRADMSSLRLSFTFSQSNIYYSPPMSPNSRTQAIARGREEMMEMVRDLPESFYELSLKDIVEKQSEMDEQKDHVFNNVVEMAKMSGKRVENKRKIVRSRSIENERFLLKTSVIFPVCLGSKKNKSKGGGGNGNGNGRVRISPMPKQQQVQSARIKGVEKDWWKRRSCKSSESDESSGLSNSGSSRSSSVSSGRSNSSGRTKNGLLPSFCFFIGRRIKGSKPL